MANNGLPPYPGYGDPPPYPETNPVGFTSARPGFTSTPQPGRVQEGDNPTNGRTGLGDITRTENEVVELLQSLGIPASAGSHRANVDPLRSFSDDPFLGAPYRGNPRRQNWYPILEDSASY